MILDELNELRTDTCKVEVLKLQYALESPEELVKHSQISNTL